MKYPVLVVKFDRPRGGYWDGGLKSGGTFEPSFSDEYGRRKFDEDRRKFIRAGTIQWGCFTLNFWFNAGAGKSWKEAAGIAKRKLQRMMSTPGTITIEWITE